MSFNLHDAEIHLKLLQKPKNADYVLEEVEDLEWATWSYGASFIPSQYHISTDALDALIYWLQSDVWLTGTGGVTQDIAVLEKFLLVAGLFYRDMRMVHFEAEDSEGNALSTLPSFITKSALKWETLSPRFDAILERMAARLPKPKQRLNNNQGTSGSGPSGALTTSPAPQPPVQADRPQRHGAKKPKKVAQSIVPPVNNIEPMVQVMDVTILTVPYTYSLLYLV